MSKNRKRVVPGEPPMRCEYPGCDKIANKRQNKAKTYWYYQHSDLLCQLYPEHTTTGYVCGHHQQVAWYESKDVNRFYYYDHMLKAKSKNHRKWVKDYCENRDGRFGYKCPATPPPKEVIIEKIDPHPSGYWRSWLHVDHIDGNPLNNDPKNLQTICANCHTFKTQVNKDSASPGRKFYKMQEQQKSIEMFYDEDK